MEEKQAHSSKTPLHQHISDWIKQEIRFKRLQIDDKIPSENELAQQFSVSRLTVRRALQTLEQENLIFRSQGLGAFVKAPISRKRMVNLNSFHEDLSQAGIIPSNEIVFEGLVLPPPHISSLLGIEEQKKVFRIDRIRFGSARPFAFDKTWIPAFYGQLIVDADLSKQSIFELLEKEYEIAIEKGCQRFDAAIADEHLAKHLDVAVNTPLLVIKRLIYTTSGKVIYYQQRYLRTDRFSYEMILERSNDVINMNDGVGVKEFLPVFEPKADVFSLEV
jgi:GntR family transcriptional regulator